LEAFKLDIDGNYEKSPSWRAGQLLGCRTKGPCPGVSPDAGDSRQIITNYGNGTTAAYKFRWTDLPTGYKAQMTSNIGGGNTLSDTNAAAAIAYVRGDQSNESSTRLRDRGTNVLGPIVNSTPWQQSIPSASYFGTTFSGYTDFAGDNKARKSLVWVGANDGMLHAFDLVSGTAGKEVFAYVPGVLANRLAEIPLQRTGAATTLGGTPFVTGTEQKPIGTIWSYVDGSPFTGDVRLGNKEPSTKADWRTYLFSSLGRGGRAVFALDTTDVTKLQSGEGNAADIFKWQFTSDDDADLGYITTDFSNSNNTRQPMAIARMNNRKFAYLLGNGYKSSNGAASLFILFVDGPSGNAGSGSKNAWTLGTDYIKITADIGPNNGLSQVMWIDLDSNGTADSIYAGDLRGNLWKFDVSNLDSSKWGVAYKSGTVNKPLFTAKSGTDGKGTTRLPITTMPQYAYGAFDGPVILFGTGTALDTADYPNTSVNQRLYGIWDRPAFSIPSSATGTRALPTDLTTLANRTLVRQADGNVKISGTPVEVQWATQDGWYATLPGTSEMVVADPSFGTREVAFTTIRPPVAGTYCTARPESSLFVLDPLSGTAKRRVLGSFVDSNGTTPYVGTSTLDQKVSIISDATGRAFKKSGGTGNTGGETCIKGSVNCNCDSNGICKRSSTCTEGQIASRIVGANTDRSLCFNANPRQQWREIPGLRTDR
jgi:type IV pilus assembly protein PilY1